MAVRKGDDYDPYALDDQVQPERAGDEAANPQPAPVPLPKQTTPAPTPQGWDAARVSQYYKDKGVTPNATSPDYWAGKWNEWGQYDPAYFETRLSQADEFTGGGGGGGGSAAPPTSGILTGTGGGIKQTPQTAPTTSSSGGDDALSKLMAELLAKNNETAGKRNALLSQISALTDRYSKPVTRDDPDIAPMANAFTGQTERATKRFREQAAERAHAEGMGTGAFDSAIGGAVLQGGRDSANFETQLMHDEMLSRRSALMQTLQQGGQLLSAQDQADIQSRVAAIDAQLKSRGLDINQSQGNRALDINQQKMLNDLFLGQGQLDLGGKSLDLQKLLGLSSLDLQRYLGDRSANNQSTSIGNQNKQWYDQFAYNAGKDTSGLDALLEKFLLGT